MSIQIFKKTVQYVVYTLFLMPFLVFPQHFIFPFVVPKVLFLRSIVVLLLALSLLIYWYNRKNQPRNFKSQLVNFWSPLAVAVCLFFISILISTFLGVDWRRSFWDTQERMLGAFTLVHYGILFFLCRYLFNSWQEWRRIFGIFLGVGMVVVLIGVIQKFIPQFLYNNGAERVVSTLGNPIYLGGFGLFLFFTGLLFFLKENNWFRWYFVSSALLGLIGIILSGTRGILLGFFIGLLVAGILFLCQLKNSQLLKKITLYLILFLVISSAFLFAFRNTSFIVKSQLTHSVSGALQFEGSARTRLMAWEVAIKAWQDYPLFGWGPNNYYYAFNKFYNQDFLKFGFQETWFDNAHNALFNALSTQGMVGLLVLLFLYGCVIYSLLKIYKRDRQHLPLLAVGMGFLVAHFVHVFFAFEDVTSYLYLFLFLAFLDALYRGDSRCQGFVGRASWLGFAGMFLAAVIIIFVTNVNVAVANNLSYNGRGLMNVARKFNEGVGRYQSAQKWYSPHQGDIDWDFAMDVLNILPNVYGNNTTTARQYYDLATQAMDRYVNYHPLDVRGRLVYTDLLRGGILLYDLPLKTEVEEQFKQAHELSPGRQQVDYEELTFKAATGEMEEAVAEMRKMIVNNPTVAEGYYQLARFLLYDHQYTEILPVLDQAIRSGVRFTDPVHLEFVAMAYEREGRFRDSLYWWYVLYDVTDSDSVKHKMAELSELTKKSVPHSLEEFFPF